MHLLVIVLLAAMYQVEPTNGTVSFSIMKWGAIREEGRFRDFRANIDYDPRAVARARVDFDVDTRSVDTNNSNRDDTLRSADFLDVAKYPLMRFRSTRVVPRSGNTAEVTGNLTIHGVTKVITVPVRLVGARDRFAGFETTFTIDRRDFGITGGRWVAGGPPGILGNEVTIRIVAGGVMRK